MAFSTDDLTEEQKRGIDAIASWFKTGQCHGFTKPVFTCGGPAGSGKSSIARLAIEACGLSLSSEEVVTATLAGKAAYVLRQKGIPSARTLHSAMYTPNDEIGDVIDKEKAHILELRGAMGGLSGLERDAHLAEITLAESRLKQLVERNRDEVTWTRNPFGPMAKAKLVLCDEASMIGGELLKDLKTFGVPMIAIGDPFQLPPIDDSGDSVFFDRRGNPLPLDYELTQIHRQAAESPIIRFSQAIRHGTADMDFTGKMTGGDGGILLRIPYERLTVEMLAGAEITLVGFNETRHRVNAEVREFLGRNSPYPEVGDRVTCLKNNRDSKRLNGELGTVTKSAHDFNQRAGTCCVTVLWDDGKEQIVDCLIPYWEAPGDSEALYSVPKWSRSKNLHLDYANALSTHRSQGSQWDGGIGLEEPFGRTPEMRRRFRYTQVTRFSKNAVMAF